MLPAGLSKQFVRLSWHCLQVTRLLSTYLQKYALFPVFTEEEVEHYLMPVEDVVDSYVVESAGACLGDFNQ